MTDFAGRRILFIGIGFYDYEASIIQRLREMQAHVVAFVDRPRILRNGLFSGLGRRFVWLSQKLASLHEKRILKASVGDAFDQILIIKGSDLSLDFLQKLKDLHPKAEFILYEWDSLRRLAGIELRLPFFHRVLTFDRLDALEHPQLKFRPLFYRCGDSLGRDKHQCDIDISFVGWLHSDRLMAVRSLEENAQALGLRTFIYLYTGFFTWLRLALIGQARSVHFRTLSYPNLLAINKRSKSIFDFPHPSQNGLTMRAIEALGMDRKLITTGKDIINYDFYQKDNVHVIDQKQMLIDRDFVLRPYRKPPSEVVQRYSLDAWINDIFASVPSAGTRADAV